MKVSHLSPRFFSRSPTMLELYKRRAGEHVSSTATKAREYSVHEAQYSCALPSTHGGGRLSRTASFYIHRACKARKGETSHGEHF